MKKCAKCGREFEGNGRFCRACAARLILGDVGKQEEVRRYVRERGEVTEYEIMEKFGVTQKFMRGMRRRIGKSGAEVRCAKCGKVISGGVYCRECFGILREEMKHRGQKLWNRVVREEGGKVILLVWQSEVLRNILERMLAKSLSGYKVECASSEVSALNEVRNKEVKLIIMEEGLTNAYDSGKIMSGLREESAEPIIILSKRSDREEIEMLMRQGANECIKIPCEWGEIERRVKRQLGIEVEERVEYEGEKVYKILLIESEEEMAEEESRILEENFNCEIIESSNGIDGLYLLSQEDFEVDLVLVSMNMPFMDGNEFLSFVREDEKMRRYPILMMAESEKVGTLRGIKNSMSKGYISKPEIDEESLDLIERVLLGEV